MLHRLGLNDQRNYAVHICLSKDTKKKGKTSLVKYCTIFFSSPNRCAGQKACIVVMTKASFLSVSGAQVPSHIPKDISLLYLLTWCLEIRSVPKKVPLVLALLHS